MVENVSIKIAIINYKEIGSFLGGQEKAVETIIKSLKYSKKIDCEIVVFSFGLKESKNKIFGGVEQVVIKGGRYDEEGFSINRILNFAHLAFFGSKFSLEGLNKNCQMMDSVKRFGPEIIITVTSNLYHFIKEYKKCGGTAKIISYLDSPKLIEDSFAALEAVGAPAWTKRILNRTLRFKYKDYYNNTYVTIAQYSDMVVIASKQDRDELLKLIGSKFNGKIKVIPPVYVERVPRFKKAPKNVKVILFAGAFGYYPNAEAIDTIKRIIAPSMPDKTFIIAGRGGKTMTVGNINFIGDVKDIRRLVTKADVCIAPLLHGSGMKQKVLDYMLSFKPVIGTAVAFNGYSIRNRIEAIVENDPNKFPLRIEELVSNPVLLRRLARECKSVCKRFTLDKLSSKWGSAIEELR
jgi:glycosyltransferase involved in cell wall biosynthesis